VKRYVLPLAVAAALVAAAIALRGRQVRPETPEAAVNALFTAAERGDDGAYLALVGGPLRASLQESRAQLGAEKFRRSLRASVAGVKTLAITAATGAPPDQAALDVEVGFADRVERQRMVLARQGGGWVIMAAGAAAAGKPAIPYGTPVFDEAKRDGPAAPPPRTPGDLGL